MKNIFMPEVMVDGKPVRIQKFHVDDAVSLITDAFLTAFDARICTVVNTTDIFAEKKPADSDPWPTTSRGLAPFMGGPHGRHK